MCTLIITPHSILRKGSSDWLCLSVSVSQSVSLSCKENWNRYIRILLTFSKHISQLENSHIITYAYLAEANAVHSIPNSWVFLLSV